MKTNANVNYLPEMQYAFTWFAAALLTQFVSEFILHTRTAIQFYKDQLKIKESWNNSDIKNLNLKRLGLLR